MIETAITPDRVPEAMREPVGDYAALVTELAGSHARGLTLFGTVVSGIFDPKRHTARSVLVLDTVDLSMLRRLSEHGPALGQRAIAAPLIMTPEYVRGSLDTFPLELIEIHQMHVTILGDDFFDDLAFEDAHVRLQCERELKTLLIGLRQGLLAAAGREAFLGELELDVGAALARTLRGMLWLKGHHEAKPGPEVVAEIERVAKQELPGVRTALDASAAHGWNEFQTLHNDIATLGEIVDAW